MTVVAVQQQPPVRLSPQRPPFSCQPSRRPSLRVTIPRTEHFMPWLKGRLCDSPLVCFTRAPNFHAFHPIYPQSGIGPEVPSPSVLLNANAVRAYLDSVHGPHEVLPLPQSLQLAYLQSPLHQLVPSKLMIEISAQYMPRRDIRHHNIHKSLFTGTYVVHSSDPNTVLSPSTIPELHTQQSQPMATLKRQASQGSIIAPNNSLKVCLSGT
jgi:hypothetical protein